MLSEKDWAGNSRSAFSQLGASNHSEYDRAEHDYYATEPCAINSLFEQTPFAEGVHKVWECACGGGNLSTRMEELGYEVFSTDAFNHGYGLTGPEWDFLECTRLPDGIDAITTNPPYVFAYEFCMKCIELGVPKFAMLLKTTFLEGKKRRALYDKYPPRYVAVFTNRISCARNGDFERFKQNSAASYSWFIWEKGYKGKPEILWIDAKHDWENK